VLAILKSDCLELYYCWFVVPNSDLRFPRLKFDVFSQ